MFLDVVAIVKTNVENSIDRLGLSGIKILNLVNIAMKNLMYFITQFRLNCFIGPRGISMKVT